MAGAWNSDRIKGRARGAAAPPWQKIGPIVRLSPARSSQPKRDRWATDHAPAILPCCADHFALLRAATRWAAIPTDRHPRDRRGGVVSSSETFNPDNTSSSTGERPCRRATASATQHDTRAKQAILVSTPSSSSCAVPPTLVPGSVSGVAPVEDDGSKFELGGIIRASCAINPICLPHPQYRNIPSRLAPAVGLRNSSSTFMRWGINPWPCA